MTRRILGENGGTPLGEVLHVLTAEIVEDERTLTEVAEAAGVAPNPVKRMLALLAERVGRLKPNGAFGSGYTALGRLLELEALMAGILAKQQLWLALHAAELPALAMFDFVALSERAASQLVRLSSHHDEAALGALVAG